MARKHPNDKPTGQERAALKTRLRAQGFKPGDADRIADASTHADQLAATIAVCKGLPKG